MNRFLDLRAIPPVSILTAEMRQALTELQISSLTVQDLERIKDVMAVCPNLDSLGVGHLILADEDPEQQQSVRGPEGLSKFFMIEPATSQQPRSEASSQARSLLWAAFLRPSLKTLQLLCINSNHIDTATFSHAFAGEGANAPKLRYLSFVDPDFVGATPLFPVMPLLTTLSICHNIGGRPVPVSAVVRLSRPGRC